MTRNPSVRIEHFDPMPGIIQDTRNGILEILANVSGEAKSLATGFKHPTGRTLNSIMWQMEGRTGGFTGDKPGDRLNEPNRQLTGYVGTNVYYAIYPEMGTRYMAAHPYMRPAIAIHAQGRPVVEVMKKWRKIHESGPIKKGRVMGF